MYKIVLKKLFKIITEKIWFAKFQNRNIASSLFLFFFLPFRFNKIFIKFLYIFYKVNEMFRTFLFSFFAILYPK